MTSSNTCSDTKVTVIVGIYNSAQFLRQGLRSIENQTWSNLEVLLMDDGSTDDSGSICDEFAERDRRFIVIHKENTGVCDSRNKGLEKATGQYVCFMDGDDWFSEDFVEYMMGLIDKTGTSMALSDKLFTTRDREQIVTDNVEIWNANKTICKLIYPGIKMGPWNKIYSMKVLRDHHILFPNHWFGETLHFASTAAYYSGKVAVGHRKVYNYRLNNVDSGTTQYNVQYRLLSLDNGENLRKKVFANDPEVMAAIEWRIYVDYFSLMMNIMGSNNRDKYYQEYNNAKRYLKKNFRTVFAKSKVNTKQKLGLIGIGLFPEITASILKGVKDKALQKDISNIESRV